MKETLDKVKQLIRKTGIFTSMSFMSTMRSGAPRRTAMSSS